MTITLDPAYDTPYVFAAAARRLAANPRSWTFASGTPADVRAIMASLGVTATPDKHGVPELHSSFVYIFDIRSRLAATVLLSTNLDDDVLRALATVPARTISSTGGARRLERGSLRLNHCCRK